MLQNNAAFRSSRIKLLALLMCCVTMFSVLSVVISATGTDSTAGAETTAPANTAATLGNDDIKNIAKLVSEAAADKKAEDKRTPRDQMTAAYLADNLDGAVAAIKRANEAQKTPTAIKYDSLTLADINALINEMKTTVELQTNPGLFDKIKLAAGSILSWLTNTLGGGNYIIGLIIFSLIIELAMLPFAVKQQKNSIKQASLKPKEAAIRKKYAGRDDQVTKNKIANEINEMYQREGYSVASGCLPMLVQLPIIFILYGVVVDPLVNVMKLSSGVSNALLTFANTSLEAGGLGQILSGNTRGTIGIASMLKDNPDFIDKLRSFTYFTNGNEIADAISGASLPNFSFLGLNLGAIPSLTNIDWLLIFPILTFLVYFASMKITRKFTYQPAAAADPAMGCSNNVMDIGMPLFSVFISFSVPAALGLYWIFKSILSTLTRVVISKFMPLPRFTEEDYKAAERELKKGSKGGSSAQSAPRPGATGKPVRSLHRIDDEDFEDTRAQALERKAKLEAAQREQEEANSRKNSAAGVKSDDDRPMMNLRDMLRGKNNKGDDKDNKSAPDENNDAGKQ